MIKSSTNLTMALLLHVGEHYHIRYVIEWNKVLGQDFEVELQLK